MKPYKSVLSLMIALSISSCQFSDSKKLQKNKGQTIEVAISSEPTSLDPRQERVIIASTITRLMFEGLFRQGFGGDLKPGLAETVDISEDKKNYTFHLRDAKWSNGDPITAYDVEYSWKSMLESQSTAPFANQLFVIKGAKAAKEGTGNIESVGISAKNAKTFVVELENQMPYFLENIAAFPFFPVNSQRDVSKDDFEPISSGPFKLEKWQKGVELVFVKNSNYWDADSVKLDKVVLKVLDDETALKLFEADEVDWMGSPVGAIPPDALTYLKGYSTIHFAPASATHWLRFNTNKTPLDQTKIRKALSYAINRQEIVHHVTQADQTPAMGIVPPSVSPGLKPYFVDHNLSKAQRLFQEALSEMGIAKEQFPTITISYTQNARDHKVAQAIQAQWKQAFGIEPQLKSTESKIFFQQLKQKDYQIAAGSWYADFRDPINFLEVFKYKTNATNNTEWEHPLFIALLDHSDRESEPEKRFQLLRSAEYLLMDEMPIAPLYFNTFSYAKRSDLQGVYFSDLGFLDFKHAYIGVRKPALEME